MENINKSKCVESKGERGLTNMRNRETSTIIDSQLIMSVVFRSNAEITEIGGHVISCTTIRVPVLIIK